MVERSHCYAERLDQEQHFFHSHLLMQAGHWVHVDNLDGLLTLMTEQLLTDQQTPSLRVGFRDNATVLCNIKKSFTLKTS